MFQPIQNLIFVCGLCSCRSAYRDSDMWEGKGISWLVVQGRARLMGKGISWLVCTGEGKAYDVVLPFGDGSTAVTVHEVTAVSLTF